MRKLVSLTLILVVLLVCQSAIFAAAAPDKQDVAVWRLDARNISEMPDSFRTSNSEFMRQPKDGVLPTREGMDTLYISGSSQFSEKSFDKMVSKIKEEAAGPIYIVDCRQESHGFMDGMAVSWYSDRNWANKGKLEGQVEKDEKARLMASLKTPPVVSDLDDNKKVKESYKLAVDNILTEKEFVTAKGLKYFRIQGTDHSSFTDDQVDDFVKFYKTLPQNAWLHFHCFAGEGRTTQAMVMVDILKNGKNVSLEEIVKRQYLIGGNDAFKVTASKEKDAYKVALYKEKVKMLKGFYEYVTTSPDDLPLSYAKWKKQNKAQAK